MKIVFIGPFGLQPKATMRVRALLLAEALAQKGHQVTMLIPPWDDPERAGQRWEEASCEGGVQVVNVALPPGIPLLFHILLTMTLVRQALVLRPEVIHFFKPKAYAGLAHFVCWWLRRLGGASARLILDSDDWEQLWNQRLPYSGLQKSVFTWQESWGLRHADAVTVASRELERLARPYRPRAAPGIFYVPNGYLHDGYAQAQRVSPAEVQRVRERWRLGSAPTILLYTRFVEFRLARIVNLVQQVAERLPEARWLIIGRGLQGEEQALQRQLIAAGLAEEVRFTGWPVEPLEAHFAAVNLAAFPYDDTAVNRTKCSVKLVDLLLAGLPVVADAVGQNCEYIQAGKTGILTPAEDDTAFAEALVRLLQDEAEQRRLGQAARQYIQGRFNWLDLAEAVEQAYEKSKKIKESEPS